MRDNGIRRAAVFTTSAWGGYSSCTQYVEDIARARTAAGEGAPELVKLRQYFDHPLFVEMFTEAIGAAAQTVPDGARSGVHRALDSRCGPIPLRPRPIQPAGGRCRPAWSPRRPAIDDYDQVWQSRSGPPQVPWLEPDIADHLTALAEGGTKAVIVCPIGFVADHIEVVWDLDHELRQQAEELGIAFARAATPNADPRFARLVADLIDELRHGREPVRVARPGRPTAAGLFGQRCGVHAELRLALPGGVQDRADRRHPRRSHHSGQRAQRVAGDLHLR